MNKEKLLLIHGWGYEHYNKFDKKNVWEDRDEFINQLKRIFDIDIIKLPGFGGQKEPREKYWTLDNYADYIDEYIKNKSKKFDYILGYSFGGAVAVSYKLKYKNKEKLILVSPAINRFHKKNNSFIKTPKLLEKLRKQIRNFYLINIIKNDFMKHGTKFLRNTYQIIVREDLTDKLKLIDSKEIGFIYGLKDTAVNPKKLLNEISKEYKDRVKIIPDGDHEIASSYPKEIIKLIKELYK
ncbi:MAG: alpha/beta hydrolase [Bacilli bacterium]